MTTDVAQLEAAIAAERAQHQEFRTQVRREVLSQHFDGARWCFSGTQGVLADLDLPPVTISYTGTTWVRVTIDAVDGATSDAEAQARVVQALDVVSSDAGITMTLEYVDPNLVATTVDDR